MSILFNFFDILCGCVDAVNMSALTCRFWAYCKLIVQNRRLLGVRIASQPEPFVCRTHEVRGKKAPKMWALRGHIPAGFLVQAKRSG